MKDLFDLTGKTAIVTGGAGILGRGFCRTLAEHGANVVIADLTTIAVEDAAQKIAEEVPVERLLPLACDVSNPKSVRSMLGATLDRFGEVHVLHNNAASKSSDLSAFFAPFESYDLKQWREIMSVNLDGMFLVDQAVGARMVSQGKGGSIIHTASVYAIVAPDNRIYEGSFYLDRQINTPAVYSASKAGVIGLSRYLATYWAEAGIRVNTLTPGGVESGQNERFKENYGNRVPLGRMGKASELHGALLYLASGASSYVTGQNIVVDGGLSCW